MRRYRTSRQCKADQNPPIRLVDENNSQSDAIVVTVLPVLADANLLQTDELSVSAGTHFFDANQAQTDTLSATISGAFADSNNAQTDSLVVTVTPSFTWPPTGAILAWRADLGTTPASPADGDPITAWADQIVGYTAVQGVGGNKPDVPPLFNSTAINGKPALDCSQDPFAGFSTPPGAFPLLPAAPSPMGVFAVIVTEVGSDPFDVIVQYQEIAFATTMKLKFGNNGGGGGTLNTVNLLGQFNNCSDNTIIGAPPFAAAVGGEVPGLPTLWKVFVNSPTPLHTGGGTFGEGAMAGNTTFKIGGDGINSSLHGMIAEILVVDLTTFDLSNWLNNWVAIQYAIPITP